MGKHTYPPLWCEGKDVRHGPRRTFASSSEVHESFVRVRMEYRKNPLGVIPPASSYYREIDRKTIQVLVRDSLPVGEEMAISCLLFALHRHLLSMEDIGFRGEVLTQDKYWHAHLVIVMIVLLYLILVHSNDFPVVRTALKKQSGLAKTGSHRLFMSERVLVRSTDALLLAALLRLVSSVLRTLTASYSSDTVTALAVSGIFVHLLACDYSYASGRNCWKNDLFSERQRRRATFRGGTVSLNASFFSTTLLASRLGSDATAFAFVSFSVVAFAFSPDARHNIGKRSEKERFPTREAVSFALFYAAYMTLRAREGFSLCCVLVVSCFVTPCFMWWIQRFRKVIVGPWDIAHPSLRNDDQGQEHT